MSSPLPIEPPSYNASPVADLPDISAPSSTSMDLSLDDLEYSQESAQIVSDFLQELNEEAEAARLNEEAQAARMNDIMQRGIFRMDEGVQGLNLESLFGGVGPIQPYGNPVDAAHPIPSLDTAPQLLPQPCTLPGLTFIPPLLSSGPSEPPAPSTLPLSFLSAAPAWFKEAVQEMRPIYGNQVVCGERLGYERIVDNWAELEEIWKHPTGKVCDLLAPLCVQYLICVL
jgi:hypothetical protein